MLHTLFPLLHGNERQLSCLLFWGDKFEELFCGSLSFDLDGTDNQQYGILSKLHLQLLEQQIHCASSNRRVVGMATEERHKYSMVAWVQYGLSIYR